MRTIIESELFAAQKEELTVRADEFDKLLDGVIWALSNRPDIFWEVNAQKNIWLIKGIPTIPYRIGYTGNHTTVTLLAIERIGDQ